ncbi:hypothetical protein ASPZODRAFT_193696 [Penicilliopsis zonata CBS 506.65]|uniref:Cell pattern formation-associated protein STUA n=1 Tax=Penicilliopsis zonata CBS 506.65 TaxID=1073090 RepID=A0A1L9STQ9_9EURO|nr:hypothetical protein ASPZODRAFT_193696 [Penicilliopsis zonata CBS 506.65]OJJ50501.1 hypothetical protein ASPZODRAFT_193696 [Penicilliopsis zonata CBS 506.65]
MNQTQSYMDVHASHLASSQPYGSQGASTALAHYPPYHQQPPILQPTSSYAPASYSQYGYANGVASPQSVSQPPASSLNGQVAGQLLPLPVSSHAVAPPGYGNTSGTPMQGYVYDTTGQMAPPGAKPRVTATLWEDEGSLCYQVEAKGVCVARREDNHMINGTKLLNVAGMTRGRRDGILKSEKTRHVVKIGPMHLKGVWIPFERALEFANKEKITDLLYPLFVHNIGGLLYHPTNQTRTNLVVQESQQRRLEGPPAGARPIQNSPAAATLHHHSLQSSSAPSHLSQAPPPAGPRPVLDRAHTFPTPPASASSLMGVNPGPSGYDSWNSQGMNTSAVPHSQPLSIDTGLSNARSLPTTPATTPPGSNIHGLPASYQSQSGYDTAKSYYSAAPGPHTQYAVSHAPLPPSTMTGGYGHSVPAIAGYMKNDMGPPSSHAARGGGQHDPDGAADASQTNGASGGAAGNEQHLTDQESEYLHDGNAAAAAAAAAYNVNRGSYTYTTNPSVSSLTGGDHAPLGAADLTGSPSQQNGSGRMTPRTSGGAPQWPSGYNTSPRPGAVAAAAAAAVASSSLYNVVSDTRGSGAGPSAADGYSVATNPAASYSSAMNGSLAGGSTKRLREDDDSDRIVRPESRGPEFEHKRRKTLTETPVVGGPVGGGGAPLALQPMKTGGVLSRRR